MVGGGGSSGEQAGEAEVLGEEDGLIFDGRGVQEGTSAGARAGRRDEKLDWASGTHFGRVEKIGRLSLGLDLGEGS